MSIHAQYRHDKKTAFLAVTQSVEIECSHFDPRSAEYVSALTKNTKSVRKLIEHNMLKPADDRKYAVKTFVEVCVKGWRTVNDAGEVTHADAIEIEPGKFMPFSTQAAEDVFNRYPQFYTDTVELARELGNFQLTETEAKNSASA